MVGAPAEAPVAEPVVTDPEPVETPTETPQEVPDESAAASPEAAAVPQVEVTEEKPDYITRAELETERRIAAEQAVEADRRKRQTENARKATAQENAQKRLARTIDTVKAAFVSQGHDPEAVTNEQVITAISRVAEDFVGDIASSDKERTGEVWDYLAHPLMKKDSDPDLDLPDGLGDLADHLRPRMQSFVNAMRVRYMADGVAEYIKNEQPQALDKEIARRNAKSREGTEELKRVEGTPATRSTDPAKLNERVAYGVDSDGTKVTQADRDEFNKRYPG